MFGIVVGFVLLITVYLTGAFIALLRKNGYRFVETCKDVVEAIQDIKNYKANQGTKGS